MRLLLSGGKASLAAGDSLARKESSDDDVCRTGRWFQADGDLRGGRTGWDRLARNCRHPPGSFVGGVATLAQGAREGEIGNRFTVAVAGAGAGGGRVQGDLHG